MWGNRDRRDSRRLSRGYSILRARAKDLLKPLDCEKLGISDVMHRGIRVLVL